MSQMATLVSQPQTVDLDQTANRAETCLQSLERNADSRQQGKHTESD